MPMVQITLGEPEYGQCQECHGIGTRSICAECNNTGKINCECCDGRGLVTCGNCNGNWEDYEECECRECGHTHYKNCGYCDGGEEKCPECGAEGYNICDKCDGNSNRICATCNGEGKALIQ